MIWKQSKNRNLLLSDTQLKDVKLGFFYTVLVLAVSTSNIILKRSHLAKKRDRPGSLTVERGGYVASGYVGIQVAQKKWEHDKKDTGGEWGCGAVGGSNFPGLLSPGNLAAKTLQLLHTGIIFSTAGLQSKTPTVCLRGEMWRRHKVTVAEMPTGETK